MSKYKYINNIELLEKKFLSEKTYTSKICHNYINNVYQLKIKYRDNNRQLKSLDIILDIIKHKLQRIRDIRSTIVSMITMIFLPLGFIVGFFGMNFRSMGNATLDYGIYSIKNAEIFIIIIISILIILTILVQYYLKYNISI